jgi:hypothetical protein
VPVVTESVELHPGVRFVDTTSMKTWHKMSSIADGLPDPTPPSGFRADVQIAMVTAGERYFVAFSHVEVDAVLEDSLASIAALDGATIVLVELDRPGRARARLLGAGDAMHAAMAVAVVKYSWAWDETEEILIDSGAATHAVRVVHAAPNFAVHATLRDT